MNYYHQQVTISGRSVAIAASPGTVRFEGKSYMRTIDSRLIGSIDETRSDVSSFQAVSLMIIGLGVFFRYFSGFQSPEVLFGATLGMFAGAAIFLVSFFLVKTYLVVHLTTGEKILIEAPRSEFQSLQMFIWSSKV